MPCAGYLEESPPWVWRPERAAGVLPLLRQLVQTMLAWRPEATR